MEDVGMGRSGAIEEGGPRTRVRMGCDARPAWWQGRLRKGVACQPAKGLVRMGGEWGERFPRGFWLLSASLGGSNHSPSLPFKVS